MLQFRADRLIDLTLRTVTTLTAEIEGYVLLFVRETALFAPGQEVVLERLRKALQTLLEVAQKVRSRAMVQKKICLLGAFAVGKTSLMSRFVDTIFSPQYHTTIGVRIERKSLQVEGQEWHLIVWDLAGEDEFLQIRLSYLRGAAGYLLVADGTRRATLEAAIDIQRRVQKAIGDVPFVLVLNKADLTEEWEISDSTVADLANTGWPWLRASAKTGAGVEEAFMTLVGKMVEG